MPCFDPDHSAHAFLRFKHGSPAWLQGQKQVEGIGLLEIELDYIIKLIAHMHSEAPTKLFNLGQLSRNQYFWIGAYNIQVLLTVCTFFITELTSS